MPGWGEVLLGEARLALIGTAWAPLLSIEKNADNIPALSEFRDERGHQRAIDHYLLSWMTHQPAPPVNPSSSADVQIWNALIRGDIEFMLEAIGPAGGPLTRNATALTLEVWTETELSILHALSHAGDRAAERTAQAADWILANLQPDNATNHPWGVHVFLARAFLCDMPEHRLYAETLLHNSIVSLGRPDRFSALLLLDSARTLFGQYPVQTG